MGEACNVYGLFTFKVMYASSIAVTLAARRSGVHDCAEF
jgi:hypothetical protein